MALLKSPGGREESLRWTDQHPASRYGLGVVLFGTRGLVLHGAQFRAFANRGAVILCEDEREMRRVAGALAWGVLALGEDKIILKSKGATKTLFQKPLENAQQNRPPQDKRDKPAKRGERFPPKKWGDKDRKR